MTTTVDNRKVTLKGSTASGLEFKASAGTPSTFMLLQLSSNGPDHLVGDTGRPKVVVCLICSPSDDFVVELLRQAASPGAPATSIGWFDNTRGVNRCQRKNCFPNRLRSLLPRDHDT